MASCEASVRQFNAEQRQRQADRRFVQADGKVTLGADAIIRGQEQKRTQCDGMSGRRDYQRLWMAVKTHQSAHAKFDHPIGLCSVPGTDDAEVKAAAQDPRAAGQQHCAGLTLRTGQCFIQRVKHGKATRVGFPVIHPDNRNLLGQRKCHTLFQHHQPPAAFSAGAYRQSQRRRVRIKSAL